MVPSTAAASFSSWKNCARKQGGATLHAFPYGT
jgi:hypothetical protein